MWAPDVRIHRDTETSLRAQQNNNKQPKKKILENKKKIQKENKRNHTDQTVKLSGAKDDVKRRRNVAEMTGHHVRNEVVLQSLLSKYVPT